MEENEFLLFDRLEVIKKTIAKYGEDKFYISFSGGKDSTVLHHLIDVALPDNRIPRVFINTGIEYNDIVNFVEQLAEHDGRFVIIKPSKQIKKTLEEYGYPFKSKEHSLKVSLYKNGSRSKTVLAYKNGFGDGKRSRFQCPKKLMYQFEDDFKLKISDKCCTKLKKEPVKKWELQNGKTIAITGMQKSEGGQRANLASCIITRRGEVVKFHPLLVTNEDFENWFIEKYDVKLCSLYYPPFNFERTGCKGCPFSLTLQQQLDKMQVYLPAERKQCEFIWKPVYDEYRRIGYRLKSQHYDSELFPEWENNEFLRVEEKEND